MKKIHLIPALFLGLFLSCKDSNQTISPSVDYDSQLLEEVKTHPSINAPVIEQNKVKNIDVTLKVGGTASPYSIQYDYYFDGKIKSMSLNNKLLQEYVYKGNTLIADKSFVLDQSGFAQGLQDNSQTKFFYKDGFLLRTNIAGDFKYTYSTTGNLMKTTLGNESLNYEYTDFPNTIRQEILKLQEFSNSARDLYLGRYSTNLIKEIKFNNLTVMTFEYEFDSQKRVTKIKMNRTPPSSMNVSSGIIIGAPAVIEYNLSY
jgi:hypothetical protein